MKDIPRNIKILSFSFFLIFFGYNGVQQYITTFFSERGAEGVGFQSLILIYLSLFIFSFFGIKIVLKYKFKKTLLFSSLFYPLFLLSLLTKNIFVIYFFSVLLGAAAVLLWTAQTSFLIQETEEKFYGKISGFFVSLRDSGAFFGILAFAFFIKYFVFEIPILVLSIFSFLGFLFLFQLKEKKSIEDEERKFNILKFLKNLKRSPYFLKLSALYFSSSLIQGLIIGILPLKIKSTFGIPEVGFFTSIFYIMPILFSLPAGIFSDKRGRRINFLLGYLLIFFSLLILSFSKNKIILFWGILLFSLNSPFIRPALLALIGDLSFKKDLEIISGFLLGIRSLGTVIALSLPLFFSEKLTYLIVFFMISFSFILIFSFFKEDFKKIKKKILLEISRC